jgi:methionyl-tRNA formyltransferase
MTNKKSKIKYVFFGTSTFSTYVLDTLISSDLIPQAIVTFPDKPIGRKQTITPNPVKSWVRERELPIDIIEVQSFKKDPTAKDKLVKYEAEVFVIASFGRILPAEVIYMPPKQTLNVHPSLLPKLRGPSPIQNIILQEERAGVTIMRIDEEMDHGPILAQERVTITHKIPHYAELEKTLGETGGRLLSQILPQWISGKIKETIQNESEATYTKMITKEDGLINLLDQAELNLRKTRAYSIWPGAYFNYRKRNGEEIRIIVKDAEIKDGHFSPTRVIPAGKKEMNWEDFLRGNDSKDERN